METLTLTCNVLALLFVVALLSGLFAKCIDRFVKRMQIEALRSYRDRRRHVRTLRRIRGERRVRAIAA